MVLLSYHPTLNQLNLTNYWNESTKAVLENYEYYSMQYACQETEMGAG